MMLLVDDVILLCFTACQQEQSQAKDQQLLPIIYLEY